MSDEPLPTPDASSKPAAPPPPAAPTPPPPAAAPKLDPGKLIEWEAPDGTTRRMTLQEMADRASAPDAPQVDPDLLQRAELLKKVQDGDQGAYREFVKQYVLTEEEKPAPKPGTPEAEIAELRRTVSALESRVQTAEQTTGQINETRNSMLLKQVVEKQAEHVPHLSKLPDPTGRIMPHINELTQLAQTQNLNTADAQVQLRILSEAMARAEQGLAADMAAMGVTVPAQADAAAQSQRQIMDDQTGAPGRQQTQQGVASSQFTMFPDGTLRDKYGRLAQQTADGRIQIVPVPGDIPAVPQAGGVAPGVNAQPQMPQRLTEKSMKDSMKGRLQQFGAQE